MNSRYFSGLAAIALLCCVPGDLLRPKSALAQESSASAESLTRLLEEHYRRPRTLRGVFLERYSEGQRQVRVESGTVYFQRPGQMRWEYDSPEPKLFLVDGKTTWFYVPYDHTVTKVPVRESSDWRTPFMLLMGKTDLARLCSRVELISQRGIPSGHAVLRCLPREAKEPRPAANSRSPQPEFTPGKAPTDVLLEIWNIDLETGKRTFPCRRSCFIFKFQRELPLWMGKASPGNRTEDVRVAKALLTLVTYSAQAGGAHCQ